MVVYDVMGKMAQGLVQVQEDVKHSIIILDRIKDRFTNPMGGWSDVLLNLRPVKRADAALDFAFELQIVHQKMLILRHDLGGHEAYEKFRFAHELLQYRRRISTNTANAVRRDGHDTNFTTNSAAAWHGNIEEDIVRRIV